MENQIIIEEMGEMPVDPGVSRHHLFSGFNHVTDTASRRAITNKGDPYFAPVALIHFKFPIKIEDAFYEINEFGKYRFLTFLELLVLNKSLPKLQLQFNIFTPEFVLGPTRAELYNRPRRKSHGQVISSIKSFEGLTLGRNDRFAVAQLTEIDLDRFTDEVIARDFAHSIESTAK